jgi:hypothetical protein
MYTETEGQYTRLDYIVVCDAAFRSSICFARHIVLLVNVQGMQCNALRNSCEEHNMHLFHRIYFRLQYRNKIAALSQRTSRTALMHTALCTVAWRTAAPKPVFLAKVVLTAVLALGIKAMHSCAVHTQMHASHAAVDTMLEVHKRAVNCRWRSRFVVHFVWRLLPQLVESVAAPIVIIGSDWPWEVKGAQATSAWSS